PPDLARHLPTAIGAAAAGALTLVDPARLRPAGRFALRSAVAGIAGVGAWSAFDTAPELAAEPGRRAAFTAAVVGLVYGAAELGEVMDAATVRGLRRVGVRRPRVVMALATIGVGLAGPHSFPVPVGARFVSQRGVPCVVRLGIEDGRLSWAVIDVDGELWAPIVDDWDAGDGDPDPLADVTWPGLDDVALVTERS